MKKSVLIGSALCLLAPMGMTWAEDITTLETMTVTANKTDENAQEVASSLSVFSSEDVDEKKMEDIFDLSTFTPNFTVFEAGVTGANMPAMRGMFADLHSHSVSVGLYVDGVPILDGMGYDQALVDVERIEVLKGPQGTLYGKGSGAGVVNIITKEPDNEFRLPLSIELGLDGKMKFNGTVSGPVVEDKFYASLTFLHDQQDGWVENSAGDTVDDIQEDYLSARLRLTPTDKLDILWNSTFLQYNNGQPHMNLSDMGAAMYGLSAQQDGVADPSFDGYDESEIMSHALNVDYLVTDKIKLTSITAYRQVKFDSFLDYDFAEPEYLHFKNNNELTRTSEELRLSSASTPIKWVFGMYVDTDKVEENYTLESVIPGMAMTVDDAEMTGTSGSLFGHMNVPFGDFSVLGGLRYDYQERDFEQPSYGIEIEDSWNEISPKVGMEYRLSDETMTYVTVSKGYLSGGFNAYARASDYMTYDEEKSWSYEVGIKNTFLDNRLILNAALFYMDITDAQVLESLDAATSYTTNAAEVTNKGFEIEAVFMPMQGLTLNGGFGYVDAEFDDFSDAEGDYSGNTKPYAPEYTFNLGASYRASFGMYCSADLVGSGEMYTDKNNEYKRDAYMLVNAKVGYEWENYDVYLYGKNIFDEEYNSYYEDGTYVVYSRSAEVGIMLNYRF